VNQLRQLMLEELQRRNFAATTIRTYLHGVAHFSRYFRRSPDQLGPEDIRYDGSTRISEWLEMGARSIHLLPLPNREDLPCADYRLLEVRPEPFFFSTACRIPVWPFVVVVKAGQRTPPEGHYRRRHAAISSCYSTPRKLRPVAGR
jgi:hypothetical protein